MSQQDKQMTVGSLFAGIGGFDLGFERAGFKTVWQVEIDDYCRRVLERHFPKAERFGDIRECGKHNLAAVDVICGGFPCQPFSSAGRRLGTSDNRHLWPEMFRVISALRPDYVVAENVAGFIALEDGRILDQVYSDLASQDYEFLPPLMVPACAFGTLHRRDRIWILAHSLRSSGSPEQKLQQKERPEISSGIGANASDSHGTRQSQSQRMLGNKRRRAINGSQENHSHVAHAYGTNGRPQSKRFGQCPDSAISSNDGQTQSVRNSAIAGLPDWAGGEMGQPQPITEFERPSGREIERDFRGVAHGVSRRVDRLRALGNAVVPQIAQWIAERIKEIA